MRIGYPSRSVTFLSMLLARDQGYFQEQGVEAELTQVKTNVGITALLNGELEYTESVGHQHPHGPPGRADQDGARLDAGARLHARGPARIRLVERLRGRTVGITNFGGSNEQTTRLIFAHYGLEPQRDVQLLPIGDAPVQYELLRQGQIDSIVVSLPFPLLAQREGYKLLVNAPDIVSMPLAGIGTLQSSYRHAARPGEAGGEGGDPGSGPHSLAPRGGHGAHRRPVRDRYRDGARRL